MMKPSYSQFFDDSVLGKTNWYQWIIAKTPGIPPWISLKYPLPVLKAPIKEWKAIMTLF